MRGARVQSTNLKPFSMERSLFFRRKHASSVIPSITYLRWAAPSNHMLYRMPRSRMAVLPWVTFNAVPLYLMPLGFHVCLHSRQGGFRWSCVGKWQFPFFLLQMGHCLDIMARFARQASCPLRVWCPLLSFSASSIASRARIWGSKISGPASRFLFATSAFNLSCRLVVPDPCMAPVATDFGMEIRRGHVSAFSYMVRQTNNSGLVSISHMVRQAKSRKTLCLGTQDKQTVT